MPKGFEQEAFSTPMLAAFFLRFELPDETYPFASALSDPAGCHVDSVGGGYAVVAWDAAGWAGVGAQSRTAAGGSAEPLGDYGNPLPARVLCELSERFALG